ncbi:MAG: four helix bundle protein [Patescibacteria group bacterium]
MEKQNVIREKSYTFSLDVVRFCSDVLMKQKKEYVTGKQFLKSGTSVGANVAEAVSAPSKKDFAHKLSIALKEARESHFWLCLIKDANIVEQTRMSSLFAQVDEIIALLTAILKTTRISLE